MKEEDVWLLLLGWLGGGGGWIEGGRREGEGSRSLSGTR